MKKLLTIISLALISIIYVNAQTSEFWGITSMGGNNDAGVIFRTDGVGENEETVFSFKLYQGETPASIKLCEANNGKLYGMTFKGGGSDKGILFEYDPSNGAFLAKVVFYGSNGSYPHGSVIQANNGKLYGMTASGGSNDLGVLFEYDPTTDTYTKKIDFDGNTFGSSPWGSLVQASNGKLYGMTTGGGANGYGVLFEYDPTTGAYTIKQNFDGNINGASGYGSLIQVGSDELYGMTTYGGGSNNGVLFKYTISSNTYTKILDFDGANGAKPSGSLFQASNGKLYGLTSEGGANNKGVLFEYDPATNSYVSKFDFDGTNNGSSPGTALAEASNGKLYGLTKEGGANDKGVLFEYDITTEDYTKKIDFNGVYNGSKPYGALMLASNGKLYGVTAYGGVKDSGVLFEYDPSVNLYTKKFNFNYSATGFSPKGSLVIASNNKLYGVAAYGGEYDKGVLFEYDPTTNSYAKKIDFDGTNKGSNPRSIILGDNGKLYGLTFYGGANGMGVLFEYDPVTNIFIKRADLDGTNTGANPYGSLMQAVDGNLYGMTAYGGVNGYGVIFKYDISHNSLFKLFDFDNTNGREPYGTLTQASNGKLYGMTGAGGIYSRGVLFEYNINTDTYTKKIDFDGNNNGRTPYGSLMQASNGKLYGLTFYGGTNDMGVLFEYNINTDTYTKKIDFDGNNLGANPNGSLMQASNGKLYGVSGGGSNGSGVIFEYNPSSDTYIKKFDFNGNDGYAPVRKLIETNICSFTDSNIDTVACNVYVAPSGITYTTSGIYEDVISNSCGSDSIITINLTINTLDNSVTQNGDTLTANQTGATYQWIDCNNNTSIAGEINQTFVASVSGNYAVEITNNGCIDTSACYTVTVTKINNNPIFDLIKIYPNPSNGIINIDLGNLQNVSLKIFDTTGKEILSKQNINQRIYKQNINAGFYIVELKANNQIQKYKLVVK